jgi:hypothetical protein
MRQCLRDIRFSCVNCGMEEEGNVSLKPAVGARLPLLLAQVKKMRGIRRSGGRHKEVCPVIRSFETRL